MPDTLTSTEIHGLQLHGATLKDTCRRFNILIHSDNLTSMISTLWLGIAPKPLIPQTLLLPPMNLSIRQLVITSP